MPDSSTPTVDVRTLLVGAGLGAIGGTSDWGIYIGAEPDDPINVITLYDTPGEPPHPKWLLDYPRFQVRVRGLSYDEAYQKADAVKRTLLSLPSQVVNGTRYIGIWVVLDVAFLRADDKGRPIFVSTWRMIREPQSGANRDPL